MNPILHFKGKSVGISTPNLDTDRITPARFLKNTDKKLAHAFFADWRKNPDGSLKSDFALNQPGAQGASILVAGDNYGCGSSREHAAWAATDFGIRVLISTSIADIHKGNCLKNGIVPVLVDKDTHEEALTAAKENLEFSLDLPNQTLTLPSRKSVKFEIDPFYKKILMQGLDELEYLRTQLPKVEAFEKQREGAGRPARPAKKPSKSKRAPAAKGRKKKSAPRKRR